MVYDWRPNGRTGVRKIKAAGGSDKFMRPGFEVYCGEWWLICARHDLAKWPSLLELRERLFFDALACNFS